MQQLVEQILQYARGMWHRRWIGLAFAWIVAIIGAVVVFRLPDKYEATARVYVDTQSLLRPLLAGMTVTPDAGQQVGILSRILLTRPNVATIIRKSDLDTAAQKPADALIDDALNSLTIVRAGTGDNIYTIAFRWTDGRKARDVVQAALSTFIEQSMGGSRTDSQTARRFLDQQIAEYEAKLSEAENRVQAFRLQHLGLVGAGTGNYLSQMATTADQIKDAQTEVRIAEQTRDGIKSQLTDQVGSGADVDPGADAAAAVANIDPRIDTLKRQVDELLRKYTDQHPDVVYTRRLIAQLEQERYQELEARRKAAAGRPNSGITGNPVAEQLKVALNEAEANLHTVRARLAVYQANYNRLKATAESLPKIDTELAQLNRDYTIQKQQYEQLVQRRETANLSGKLEDAGGAEFRIIEPPRVTPNPVAPNRLVLLFGVLGGSLLAGIVASFVMSEVRPTFHDGRGLREIVNRPLLGMVSTIPSPGLQHQRMRAALLFAGGLGGLLVSYGAAILFTYLTSRGS
jgi:polysaccharide chain length determinant protein (PEP-CTERM system associated)